jgi:hypothetical protein
MNTSSEILQLWQQHCAAAFPKGYGKKEINGIDLPLLDAEIASSIHMYMHHGGTLDSPRAKTLRKRLIDLNTIVLLLDQEELTYFDRLRRLANLILQEMENK